MTRWTPYPQAGRFGWTPERLRTHWARLHAGDAEPLPDDPKVLAAWVQFHNGEFQQAHEAGLALGADGATLALKAACIQANHLEVKEKRRLDRFLEMAVRAEDQQLTTPGRANVWFWHAYALGRYSQGISVAKALAQGVGARVRASLEQTLRLRPDHPDAVLALGAWHAEVIDKVGPMVAQMTYGARRDQGRALLEQALALNPHSPVVRIEVANGLVMLDGESRLAEAELLYAEAAAIEPMDAMEQLDIELARTELMA